MSSVSASAELTSSLRRARRRSWLLASGALILFLILSVGFSYTRAPWWDEGVFADVAMNFRTYGRLGSSVLDPHGYLAWPEVHRYTYWQFPAYLIALGTWLRIVPDTIEWIRFFSVLWGCLYVYCWFALVRCLSRDEPLALFIASIVALDYSTVAAASNGRMDMMCAALGQAGLASYVCLKSSGWTRALLVAGCFAAGSLFCHPMGALENAALAVLVFLDWRQIRWKGLVAASLPYLAGGVLWLRYVSQAPAIFLAQTRAASSYRVGGFQSMIRNEFNDLHLRYWDMYAGLPGIFKLKAASLLFAVVGTLGLASNHRLRSQPLGRSLLLLALISYIGVAAIDNQKFPIYFVYSLPLFSACGALWVYDRWGHPGITRFVAAGLLLSSLLATIGGFFYKIYEDDYDHLYRTTIRAVRAELPTNGLVMGGSELGFALGFNANLIDDRFVGYYSGKRPDVFVENKYYGRGGAAGQATDKLLHDDYHLTYQNSAYNVYVRNNVSSH